MTTATGKSGRYRYYACQKRINSGPTTCKGRRLPRERLDKIVTGALIEHVTAPHHLMKLLEAWLAKSGKADEDRRRDPKQLRSRLTKLDDESARVIKLVRSGLLGADDPQIGSELAQIAAQKKAISADVEIIDRQLADPQRSISPKIVEKLSQLLRQKLASPVDPLRREYVRLLIDRVEVRQQRIRIVGSKSTLVRAVSGTPPKLVPKAEREWRTRQC